MDFIKQKDWLSKRTTQLVSSAKIKSVRCSLRYFNILYATSRLKLNSFDRFTTNVASVENYEPAYKDLLLGKY